ncbi:twin-arginine translocation signal domain-containing protein [Prolixibacteraceae bacterium JC049]|nr:twin-arginine translocation signal domain-containing protein [Prolixibacteraceae bacterium JC049]
MTNRRDFLKSAAAFAVGAMVLPAFTSPSEKKIGLQLYSVRDEIKKDLDLTLAKLAKIGYNSAELAGFDLNKGTFYGMSPREFAGKMKVYGLEINSSHSVFRAKDAEKVCSAAAEVGTKYLVHPCIQGEFRKDVDSYKRAAEELNKIGEVANKYGVRFGYHNHDFEFKDLGGQKGMDILLNETDPKLVTFEVDMYWVTKAGYNPIGYLSKFPGRFELFHVKDMTKTEDRFFAPVGHGRIDFEQIFALKDKLGMKYFFVEQDSFKTLKSLQSMEMSYKYLSNASWL